LVRAAALTNFALIAADGGIDGLPLLRDVGLPPRCLDDPDLKVPARAVSQLLELAAERAHEPAFGLRLAESRRLSNLGPLGLLMRDEPTLRDALEVVVRYVHLHNEALSLRIEQISNLVVIRQEFIDEGLVSVRQASELALGVLFRMLGIFLGAGWRPRLVCFVHRAPASMAVHRRVFGEAVEFGHEFNGIVCNASNLDAPNPGADPVMARYTHRLLAHGASNTASMGEQVRQLAVLLLPRGHCRVEAIAQHLGVDRRTVARKLAAEGTSFSALLDSLRSDLLTRYLDDGGHPLSQVAALLGFSSPSSFSRWHRAQFGSAARQRWAAKASPPR
jgi:AraC-like DNA-binding protein